MLYVLLFHDFFVPAMSVAWVLLLGCLASASGWSICDVSHAPYAAVGDGIVNDAPAIHRALLDCDEVVLPEGGTYLTGPLNLTSNQRLVVDGTLLASTDRRDYTMIAPLMGYGWGSALVDAAALLYCAPRCAANLVHCTEHPGALH